WPPSGSTSSAPCPPARAEKLVLQIPALGSTLARVAGGGGPARTARPAAEAHSLHAPHAGLPCAHHPSRTVTPAQPPTSSKEAAMARNGLSLVLCAGLALVAISPGAARPQEPDRFRNVLSVQAALDEGRALIRRGEYGAAVRLLEGKIALIDGN